MDEHDTVEFFQDDADLWAWRYRRPDGLILAVSYSSYADLRDARRNANHLIHGHPVNHLRADQHRANRPTFLITGRQVRR